MSFFTHKTLLIFAISIVGCWQIIYGHAEWVSKFGVSVQGFNNGEYYRLIIGPLGHVTFVHYWLNIIIFVYVSTSFFNGNSVRLKILFYAVFVLAIIFGALSYSILGGDRMSVGISGGLFGLIGCSLIIFDGVYKNNLKNCVIVTFILGVLFPNHIDNITHAAGLLLGITMGKIYLHLARQKLKTT